MKTHEFLPVFANLRKQIWWRKATRGEFVKIVVDENYKKIQATQKLNQEKLGTMLGRAKRARSAIWRGMATLKQLDILIEKLVEEKILSGLHVTNVSSELRCGAI